MGTSLLNETITGKHKLFIALSFSSFFMLSFPMTVQGSIAPVTMEYYGINAAQQGLIMTMQSLGSIFTGIFLALKGEKYNKTNIVALGALVICVIATLITGTPTYIALLLLIAVMGVGTALLDVMTNSVFTDVYPKQKNTLLPFVHAFFSTGATVVPIIVAKIVNPLIPESFTNPFKILSVFGAVLFVLYLISSRRIVKDTPYTNMEAMKKRVTENPAEIFKTKKAWFFLIVGILYFTFQVGILIWMPTFAIQNKSVDFETGSMLLTAFFGGSLVMRFMGPLFLRRFTLRQFYAYFGLASAILMAAALFVNNIPLMIVLVAVSGFLQGSIVATLVLMLAEAFPERTASAASVYALSANIGFLSGPLWMGALSEYTGFLIPMVLICIAFLISAALILFMGVKRRSQ